eukprot:Protomagalhaensia_wolfi_Nauph_80__5683@NODE_669_length_2149_cov_11_165877_g496_i0_p3_GENE_NODE_669_length_2149_cov_11_165877_g496_i0NODE_669_length_2149_cov_11_165877_g496_i0_p3_ORF_typecomplete_len161_score30_11DUF3537/PF12056_8/0_56_NODE_669_length_2149_cov_11_165877_g496_i0216698
MLDTYTTDHTKKTSLFRKTKPDPPHQDYNLFQWHNFNLCLHHATQFTGKSKRFNKASPQEHSSKANPQHSSKEDSQRHSNPQHSSKEGFQQHSNSVNPQLLRSSQDKSQLLHSSQDKSQLLHSSQGKSQLLHSSQDKSPVEFNKADFNKAKPKPNTVKPK